MTFQFLEFRDLKTDLSDSYIGTSCLILDIMMCYSNSKNKIISTSNTSVFIVDRSRQNVSTLKGSSSGLIFETSL